LICMLRFLLSPEAGTRPGGRVTFFVSPKKVTKERRPHCARPFASLRATCGARFSRGPRNSLRSDRRGPDPRKAALLGARRGDWNSTRHGAYLCFSGLCFARPL